MKFKLFNVCVYIVDVAIGAMFTSFIIFYLLILILFYRHYNPKLFQEMINFATRYRSVQKKLLNEFEIPYALLDYNAKILNSK